MAKSKKETSSETPIVVNWVNENASKLSEVRSMNPTLYSAITMALDYLNKSLGGVGDVVMPEQYQAQPTETVISYTDISKSWVKSDFLGKIVMVSSNAQARGFQKLVLDLGIRWADGSNKVELTRYRLFEISDEGIMFAMTDDPNSFVTKNRTNLIFFDELGIAPIKEVMTAKEIERSSIFVSNKEELNYLQEVLQNEFGFESYGTQVLPRNSVFYINVNETDFRISATPQARVLYNLSELGKDPIYKSPDDSTDLKFTSGDRFIYNNSNVYNKSLQGFETYRLNIIDNSTTTSVEVSFADNVEGSRTVNWVFVTDPDTLEDFRQKAMDGDIRILSKRPIYEEGTTVGNYEILQIGFAKNDFDEGYDFLYQTYRKDTNSFLSISETNLVKLFEMPKAPRSKNIDPLTTNLKIKINTEAESRAFQEWAFSFGIEWFGGGSYLDNLTFPYLYIENKMLDWGQDDNTFNNFNELEVTLADLGIVLPLPTIDPLTTNLKIKINTEAESRAFQVWAFSFGIEWYSGGSNLEHLTSKYLYIDNKVLDWDDETTAFNTSNYLEVTLADLGIVVPLETITPLTTDIKIEVDNEDEARAFQEWAFNNGVKWWSARTSNLNHLGEKYFIIDNGLLVFDEDLQSFQNSPARLVTLKDLGIVLPLETITPLTTDIKIEVKDSNEARAFQEWAFSKGIKWLTSSTHFDNLDSKYFIIEKEYLYYDSGGTYFRDSPAKLVTLADLGIVLPLKTIDPLVDDIKIEVDNENEARAFQEWAFKNGVTWNVSKTQKVKHLNEEKFFIESGLLMFDEDGRFFRESLARLVTLKDLGITVPKTNVAVKKTPAPKVKTTPPAPKPDVQNLYNELDDLDI
jgi:hypothetical protein